MPIIRALPQDIADKIAAGEVVERPLSIVKELVENSIDAGASSITVEISRGGKDYIRVTDNGCGIEKDQLKLAFQRYATSKIYTEEDLSAIKSLGFRGEALASICAVSSTEILTKPAGQRSGTRLVVTAGEYGEFGDYACEEGTTIVVRELFFNIPARKKFLKADSSEASLITDYISKMSLAYTGVRFRMINNGTILFSTQGKGSVRNAIATVYSPVMASKLVEISGKDENLCFELNGFVSPPSESALSRRKQVFFVNGRWVKSRLMEQALDEAFKDKLFEGRFPSAFLFLNISPSDLDVNIHPNKTDIRFYSEEPVKEFMVRTIRLSLLIKEAAPEIALMRQTDKVSLPQPAIEKTDSVQQTTETKQENRIADISSSPVISAVLSYPQEQKDIPLDVREKEERFDDFFRNLRNEKKKDEEQLSAPIVTQGSFFDDKIKDSRFCFSTLEIIGQVFAGYIIAKDENNVYFIDQHAAHERILYEKLLAAYNSNGAESQMLLIPLLINLPPSLKLEAEERLDLLRKLGFSIEEFGPDGYAVKEIPASMDGEEAEDFISSVLESESLSRYTLQQKREKLISRACKSAVKANRNLDRLQIEALFAQLDKCENPFSCPHGRPSFLRLTHGDLERMFLRK